MSIRPPEMNEATVTTMETLDARVLRELATWTEGPCVSIYLPLDPKHPNIDAYRLTLKDLVRDARQQLEGTTMRRPAIDDLLEPAEALLVADRWPLGSRGYGLFSAPGHAIQLQLDVEPAPMAVVADRFVITPLVAAVSNGDRFFVLAISQHRVRLFRGGRDGLVDVAVPGLPASSADALWYEHHERQLSVHSAGRQGVDQITGVLQGSPSERDLRKQQLLRFFRIVDQALARVLHGETAPLLIAGVDYELAVYKEANRYPHLDAVVDTGNPERLDPVELHAMVWPVAAGLLDAPRRKLLERIDAAAESLTLLPDVLAACEEGRVAALLVEPDRLVWGQAETADGHAQREPDDIDLISAAIGAALDQGATVYPASPGELPGDAPLAAVARY